MNHPIDRAPPVGELPLVVPLYPMPDAEGVFRQMASLPHCIFFDSALRDPVLGRYSFLAADPFEYVELPVAEVAATTSPGTSAPMDDLARRLAALATAPVAGLPPFQGGAAGMVSYDLGRQLERLPSPRCDEFALPALAVGLYDAVISFDHAAGAAWIVSQGFPETDPARRRQRARRRADELLQRLRQPAETSAPDGGKPLAIEALAPQFPVGSVPGLLSNFTADDYLQAVERAIEYIRAGDIFQVNLSQRLLYPADAAAVPLYLRLRQRNPATFAGYFDLGPFQICSASPERFLRVVDGAVEARPIKGTRQRTVRPEADLYAGDELRQSVKDRAENVMIVDLLRNDLSRVCRADSVVVTQLCRLESYQYVQHLVSAVQGQLREGLTPIDAWRASFPGGSITGAPKIRAMEIIAELEPTARGAYCGGLFYHGFDAAFDSSILIRTITAGRGWWQIPVGGGIVAQSQPQSEYEETWHKAAGMLRALR